MKVFRGSSAVATRAAAVILVAVLSCAAKQRPVDQEVLSNSAIVLGRIGVAKLALAYGLKGEAQANIRFAIDTAEVLKASATKFSLKDPMTFGRLSYRSPVGDGQSFVPFLKGAFSTQVLDEKLLRSGDATRTELTDAEIASVQVSIDGNELMDDLAKAETAMKMNKPDDALSALNAITEASLTPEKTAQGTLQLARDSLGLAQQFLRDKDYKAAAFAAGHAHDALAAAARTDDKLKAKAADTDKAVKGLDDLGDAIRSARPVGQKSPDAAASDLAKQLEVLAVK